MRFNSAESPAAWEMDQGIRTSGVSLTAPATPTMVGTERTASLETGAPSTPRNEKHNDVEPVVEGVSNASPSTWDRSSRWVVIVGLALIMIIYEIDNSTVYIYNNYSTSEFGALSLLAALSTATAIVFAVVKPPIAKLSNVIGRGETYCVTISFYVLGYILMASSTSINTYAAGAVFYTIGQSGTNIMTTVVVSDITTARWRAFAIGFSFFPFLITPWVAAFIVESVVNGIGWRWGIGMLAILMPVCASVLIVSLLYYQRRAKKLSPAPPRITFYEFWSQVDLGGILLFSGGLALLLLPMTLAATTPSQWQTPYLGALIGIGALLLIALPFYENKAAKHPLVPPRYFQNRTIAICLFLIGTDALGFSASHTYLYAWATVAHDFDARTATFYVNTNGVTQALFGILVGLAMARTRRYKYLVAAAAVVRLVGYGVMLRLRGADNAPAELFVVQLIQGIGSGIVQTALLVPAQISVPHVEMPQITALLICINFLGSSVGSCIAGGIYTNTLQAALWRRLGDAGTPEMVEALYNSIVGILPDWGTPERDAVNLAFTDVMQYMTYAALAASIPALVVVWFLPNHRLPETNNLVEEE